MESLKDWPYTFGQVWAVGKNKMDSSDFKVLLESLKDELELYNKVLAFQTKIMNYNDVANSLNNGEPYPNHNSSVAIIDIPTTPVVLMGAQANTYSNAQARGREY